MKVLFTCIFAHLAVVKAYVLLFKLEAGTRYIQGVTRYVMFDTYHYGYFMLQATHL